MTEIAKLAERLHRRADGGDLLAGAAARALTSLAAKHKALRVKTLAALEPFTNDELMEGLDAGPDDQYTGWPRFQLGAFRAARALHAELTEEGE